MVSVAVSAAASQPTSVRGLPCTVEIPGTIDKVTVAGVKAALVAKFPRVRLPGSQYMGNMLILFM